MQIQQGDIGDQAKRLVQDFLAEPGRLEDFIANEFKGCEPPLGIVEEMRAHGRLATDLVSNRGTARLFQHLDAQAQQGLGSSLQCIHQEHIAVARQRCREEEEAAAKAESASAFVHFEDGDEFELDRPMASSIKKEPEEQPEDLKLFLSNHIMLPIIHPMRVSKSDQSSTGKWSIPISSTYLSATQPLVLFSAALGTPGNGQIPGVHVHVRKHSQDLHDTEQRLSRVLQAGRRQP